MAAGLYGPDATNLGPGASAAGWMGGSPDDGAQPQATNTAPPSRMVSWCRNTAATLKREGQIDKDRMRRNANLASGGTPWWRERPRWKIGTRLNFCATIPLTWKAILGDAEPSVAYVALDRSKQRRADIATAAWNQAYEYYSWDEVIGDAILASRVQTFGYLSLRPHLKGGGAQVIPYLQMFTGEQIWMDRNARSPQDPKLDVLLCEYRESYGSLIARYKDSGLKAKLRKKYQQQTSATDPQNEQSQLAPPAAYSLADVVSGGGTVYTPPYAATPNPPDSAAGSAGILVQEFWTRPHGTHTVEEVQFLSTGEPATRPKLYDTIDPADAEPLRRITTEGGVIYELPESLVAKMYDAMDAGGIGIVNDQPALECLTHKVDYPLYPDGRLVVIVDDDIEADDRMNPLGYIPFAQIEANPDPGGSTTGPSDVDLICDVYEHLVRMVAMVHDIAQLTANPVERIPEDSSLMNDDITNAPGAIRREDLATLKYGKREKGPELPQYVLPMIKFDVDQIKELSGLSDMATGKIPPKAQISTETVTTAQEASGVRFRDSLGSLSRAMKTLGEHFLEFMARFYTSPVIVQVKNDAGVPEPIPMLGAYLTDPFIVEAKAGSHQTTSPTNRFNTLISLKNAGVPIDLETMYDLAQEIGIIKSSTATMRRVEQLHNDPKQMWKLLGIAPPGQATKKPGSKRQKKGNKAA